MGSPPRASPAVPRFESSPERNRGWLEAPRAGSGGSSPRAGARYVCDAHLPADGEAAHDGEGGGTIEDGQAKPRHGHPPAYAIADVTDDPRFTGGRPAPPPREALGSPVARRRRRPPSG